MTEYHTVYRGPAGETTQWDDIQRRLGNLPPKPAVWKPDKYTPEQEQAKGQAWLDGKDAEELSEAEDELEDDRFLEAYRQRRIHELQNAVRRPRFGAVETIRGAEFVQKVTEASKGAHAGAAAAPSAAQGEAAGATGGGPSGSGREARAGGAAAGGADTQGPGAEAGPGGLHPESGIWVVVQLYKDGHGGSALMSKCIDELAERYPHTKFVRIVSTDCIPKYPDTNLPTLLVYHRGTCIKHLVGLPMFGGQRATPEQVALVLNQLGPVCSQGGEEGEEAGQGEDVRLIKKLVQRIVRDREEEQDEDSDFDS